MKRLLVVFLCVFAATSLWPASAFATDSFAQLPADGTGKKSRAVNQTCNANDGYSFVSVLGDPADCDMASIMTGTPSGSEGGLVTRNIPSGVQKAEMTNAAGTQRSFVFPWGAQYVTMDGSALFSDTFDSGIIDTTDRWNGAVLAGSGAAVQSNSQLSLQVGQTANNAAALSSQAEFTRNGFGFLKFGTGVKLEATIVTNTHRFWGLGTPNASFTAATPLTNAVGFEIKTDGNLYATIWAGATEIVATSLTKPTDGSYHAYVIHIREDAVLWYIDDLENPVASSSWNTPYTTSLPVRLHAINHTTGPGSSPVLTFAGIGLADSSNSGVAIQDGSFGWRKAEVNADNTLSVQLKSSATTSETTTTLLNTGTSYTTQWFDTSLSGHGFTVSAKASHDGHIYHEESNDQSTVIPADDYDYTAAENAGGHHEEHVAHARYSRFKFTNDSGINQTSFVFTVIQRHMDGFGTMRISPNGNSVKITDGVETANVNGTGALDVDVKNASLTVGQGTGSNLHMVSDSGSTTACTQGTASNLKTEVTQGAAAAASGRWPFYLTDGTNSMPTGDAAARGIYERITDGTNTAAVEAANSSPILADPALIVVESPNPSPVCTSSVAINQTTGTTVITGTASQYLYICSIVLVSASAQNVSITEGTGTVCATGAAALIGGTTASVALAANTGFVINAGSPWLKSKTAADNLCILQSGSGNISGIITYVSRP